MGDVSMNIYNLPEAITQIKAAYDRLVANGCTPLTMGGDHTITYPILQAIKVSWLLVVVVVVMMWYLSHHQGEVEGTTCCGRTQQNTHGPSELIHVYCSVFVHNRTNTDPCTI